MASGGGENWRSRWRKNALHDGLRETKAFLTQPTYERATAIAERRSERLPVTLGRLIEVAVTPVEHDTPTLAARAAPSPTSPVDIIALTRAILASRFPEDTGSARFRQLAFVHLVISGTLRGDRPTATSLAVIAGSHKSQLDLLAKILVTRGVIMKTHVPGLHGAPAAKALGLSPRSIDALQAAHVAATGAAIAL
jgi:hypothetical protein